MPEIPTFIREHFDDLKQDLQSTYLKWKMYKQIFESEPNVIEFLDDNAPSFFLAVRDSFLSDLVTSVARFTDKTKNTLTLSHIIKKLEKSTHHKIAGDLLNLQDKIITLSEPIKKHRDNLVAHKSLKSIGVSPREPMPNLSWNQIDTVLVKIANALNLIQKHFADSETGYANIITHGDANEVIRLMRLGREAELARINSHLRNE